MMKRKSSHNKYMRSKLKLNRSRRITNFGILIHWVGFFCLLLALILLPLAAFRETLSLTPTINIFLDFMFDFENLGYLNSGDEPAFWIVWIALTHWPLKCIFTGKRGLFPWK